jgi:hypothetical protein
MWCWSSLSNLSGFANRERNADSCEHEATSPFAAQVIIDCCCANQSMSSGPARCRFLGLLRQFLDSFNRHSLDVHHFAAEPAAEANCKHSND